MSTVSWGKRNRYRFSGYGALSNCVPPKESAVFAITYRQDPELRPKAHTVLMFGEGDDLSTHFQKVQHEALERWQQFRQDASAELYIFVHSMPGSTRWERSRIQSQLVSEYDPQGNEW